MGQHAYNVDEGTVHLFSHDDTSFPIRDKLDHCLYVLHLLTKTNGDICRLFSSRHVCVEPWIRVR
jgi:hypothetical protein